jgi:hypothetical protein
MSSRLSINPRRVAWSSAVSLLAGIAVTACRSVPSSQTSSGRSNFASTRHYFAHLSCGMGAVPAPRLPSTRRASSRSPATLSFVYQSYARNFSWTTQGYLPPVPCGIFCSSPGGGHADVPGLGPDRRKGGAARMPETGHFQPAAQRRFFRYKVRFRGRDSGRCGGPRECGHSRTGTTGHKRSVTVLRDPAQPVAPRDGGRRSIVNAPPPGGRLRPPSPSRYMSPSRHAASPPQCSVV